MDAKINSELEKLNNQIGIVISKDETISLAIDITRHCDSKITKLINDFKLANDIKISSKQKNEIRDYIIGSRQDWILDNINPIDLKGVFSKEEIYESLVILNKGIDRNKNNVLGTIKARLGNRHMRRDSNAGDYSKIISELEQDNNQLLIIHIKAGISDDKKVLNEIKSAIFKEYEELTNYHNLAIVFEDGEESNIEWRTISKVAIFCEYLKIEENFNLFNKQKEQKKSELNDFIKNNENINYREDINTSIEEFYSGLSYGFQFNDLLISKDAKIKILLMQKIQLDEKVYPCPDCMQINVRGNSYPKLLLRSFECQNSDCPSRSKIGRGKRYDLLNVKRNTMLQIGGDKNLIPEEFAKKYRRDVFEDSASVIEMLVRFYSWSGNNILIISNFDADKKHSSQFGRKIKYKNLNEFGGVALDEDNFSKFFRSITKHIDIKESKPTQEKSEELYFAYNGDSSKILNDLPQKITGAVTSPPYYNAREYSQWPNLLCYLIDMAVNASAVYKKLEAGSYYFYNIGDIVGQDNVYISSHMSKRRLMLGFYSAIIFEFLGFNFIDNVIWDKGEVQSKRNSNSNLYPGYIKPINCYEHILIFSKAKKEINLESRIISLDSVKKINSKGENLLGHTAPYPEKLVELIFDHFDTSGYLLDPFLGSGTTIISSNKNGTKSIGIELNKEYYDLAISRIENTSYPPQTSLL